MNRPSLHSKSERGIALVITLIMLAVVTVMAIVFLALSRSERRSVLIYEDLTTANYMSEAALERAKAQAIAHIASSGSKLHYDLFNSTNYINPMGFDPSKGASPTNVSYTYANGNPVTGKDLLQAIANLQYDPRPPVFVQTNENGNTDFRYYLDFNRNRVFETNGMLAELDFNGDPILDVNDNVVTNHFVGDPEWIGVLERPDYPHSESNRFVGRMAYLVLPAGKTLDVNYIHNQSIRTSTDELNPVSSSVNNGYTRNHGYGSWELNLAAFFRELNTNNYAWHRFSYRQIPGALPAGEAFDDARAFLNFRYGGRRSNLSPAPVALGGLNSVLPNLRFDEDNIDNYGDDTYASKTPPDLFDPYDDDDDDYKTRPWPGAINTNAFHDVQQLFSTNLLSPGFVAHLRNPMHPTRLSSYDRYTFYRLLAQLGTDSTPALKGKIHLNYQNPVGQITNNVFAWTNAVQFITNAAQLMFEASMNPLLETARVGTNTRTYRRLVDTRVSTNFSINNIQVYSIETNTALMSGDFNNEYTPTVHRLIQVAANIYDNMTNHVRLGAPYFPTVLRPIFRKTPTNIVISGFVEVTNATTQVLNRPFYDMADFMTNSYPQNDYNNLYGQHLVVGAKQGHPNFNELSLRSYLEVSRKIELRKRTQGALQPEFTNQLFVVNLMNQWGMEAWNSYAANYPRQQLQVHGEIQTSVYLRDAIISTNPIVYSTNYPTISRTYPISDWPGRGQNGAFQIVLSTNLHLLQDADYSGQRFTPKNTGQFRPIEPAPRLNLYTTNNVMFYLMAGNRIIDFVSFGRLSTMMDISRSMYPDRNEVNEHFGKGGFNEAILWDPTPIGTGPNAINVGIQNQLRISSGELELDESVWRSFKLSGDKDYGIALWRQFVGLQRRQGDEFVMATNLAYQTPFVPTRRMHQLLYWQANDPLVHYLAEDIGGIRVSGNVETLAITKPLPGWNIGNTNRSVIKPSTRPGYHPWGGDPQRAANEQDPYTYNVGLQDPGIRTSDDWDFPIGNAAAYKFRTIGDLGKVHRGTPWQTIYMKAIHLTDSNNVAFPVVELKQWTDWAGSLGTFPSQDWKILDRFTTAPNEAAASGLLSINQTNPAAWSAVLSGLLVLTNDYPSANLTGLGDHQDVPEITAYEEEYIQPASPQIEHIVRSINVARQMQTRIIGNTNAAELATKPFIFAWKTNTPINTNIVSAFENLGDILYAPGLTLQSPYLNTHREQVQHVLTDEAIEFIPQRILGLLQRDEPRFVVYAFGQSLKPAPGAMNTSADYYGLVTNYQITGEVITKTVFRVEGDVPYYDNNGNLLNPGNPLRAVVESYHVLPPPE